jgi:hypothetical protein
MALFGAAFSYWLLALALGFALGAVRELALKPLVGASVATLIELPLILSLLWLGCGWIVRRFRVNALAPRAVMGGLWFCAFLATEYALGAGLRGWSFAETSAHFVTPQGALGLGGFVCAALFPVWAPRR